MSVAACTNFLQEVNGSAELNQQMKSVTGVGEIVVLARALGYEFGPRDLAAASVAMAPNGATEATKPAEQSRSAFYHYEFDLDSLPGFGVVADELAKLRIMPPDIDLAEFDTTFREGDLATLDRCPADADYQRWHTDLAARHWRDADCVPGQRRDFHLVNLDEHIDHAGYAEYFAAKQRVIGSLEDLLGGEVRFSGSLWYPPHSYRLWHTNETQPGWRMYLVDLDEPFGEGEQTSYFRYMNPNTHEIVTLSERPRLVRFFRIEQEADKLFWHCIANPSTQRHRWSFGFAVPDSWQERLSDAIESR